MKAKGVHHTKNLNGTLQSGLQPSLFGGSPSSAFSLCNQKDSSHYYLGFGKDHRVDMSYFLSPKVHRKWIFLCTFGERNFMKAVVADWPSLQWHFLSSNAFKVGMPNIFFSCLNINFCQLLSAYFDMLVM